MLLLLLPLGLEYNTEELRQGLRGSLVPGAVDGAANFTPGFAAGLVLGWDATTALLLGGVCWVSSSDVVAKVLSDLDRLGNRETPAILNLLVTEDLAMAAYLPVAAALVAGRDLPAHGDHGGRVRCRGPRLGGEPPLGASPQRSAVPRIR